jgi:hypothetical protein
MSRLIEEPKLHIHSELCSEVNEMSIRIKLALAQNQRNIADRSAPAWREVADLLDRVCLEMNQCTQPLKIR